MSSSRRLDPFELSEAFDEELARVLPRAFVVCLEWPYVEICVRHPDLEVRRAPGWARNATWELSKALGVLHRFVDGGATADHGAALHEAMRAAGAFTGWDRLIALSRGYDPPRDPRDSGFTP